MPSPMRIASAVLEAIKRPSETKAMIQWKIWRDPLHSIEANPEASGWNREDMKQCYKFLDLTSRSFAAVIKELEGELGRVVALFYLILRGLDTIEDDMTIDIAIKGPLLEAFYLKLEEDGWNFKESGPNEKDAPLLVDFQVVIAEFKLLEPHYKKAISDITREMGAGMARYCRLYAATNGKFSVDTLASFDLYCHYVAGLVGEGLSRLFSASGKESPMLGEQLTLSNSMGLMLQKTNILRDFREDTDEGRVFWPAEIWKKYVDKPEELYAVGNEEKAMWALSEMAVDALTHATDALDYLTLLTNQSIFNFCAIPQVMAVATLDACFMNPEVMHKNVKIRKGLAVKLILAANNPRDVAYIFRDTLRAIHSRARANDPSFIKLAVLAGRVEQWTESRYPSFVQIGTPIPRVASDWREGADARIKQLGMPAEDDIADPANRAARANAMETRKLSGEDYKFLAVLVAGMIGMIFGIVGIAYGAVWFLVLREGAPYADTAAVAATSAVASTVATAVSSAVYGKATAEL